MPMLRVLKQLVSASIAHPPQWHTVNEADGCPLFGVSLGLPFCMHVTWQVQCRKLPGNVCLSLYLAVNWALEIKQTGVG